MSADHYEYHIPKMYEGVPVTDKMKYRLGATPYDDYRKHYFGFTGKFKGRKKNRFDNNPSYWILDSDCNVFNLPNGLTAKVTSKSGSDRFFSVEVIGSDQVKETGSVDEKSVLKLLEDIASCNRMPEYK